jgi:1,4-dihydroxy-2-naphthoate octaprenyltransferase
MSKPMSEILYKFYERFVRLDVASVSAQDVLPSRIQVWWRSIRPATLSAGAAPVAVGAGLAAEAGVSWTLSSGCILLGALIGSLLIQIGCNLVNDYADFERGIDND